MNTLSAVPVRNISHQKHSVLLVLSLLLLAIIPLWPAYAVVKLGSLPGINLQRITTMIIVGVWVANLSLSASHRTAIARELWQMKWLVIVCGGFFAWRFLAAGMSVDKMRSFYNATNYAIYNFGAFIVAALFWRSRSQLRLVATLMVVTSILISGIAFLEVLRGQNLFLSLVTDPELREALHSFERGGRQRIAATFIQPLALAEYMGFVLPVAIALAVKGHSTNIRWTGRVAVVLGLVTATLTASRSAIMAGSVVSGAFLLSIAWHLLRERYRATRGMATVVLGVPTVLATLGVVGVGIVLTLDPETLMSSFTRVQQHFIGIPLIIRNPLFGYGPGMGATVLDMPSGSIDSYYLMIALESGLLSLVVFLGFVGFFIVEGRRLRTELSGVDAAIVSAVSWSLLGFLVFASVVALREATPIVFMSLGLLVGYRRLVSQPGLSRIPTPGQEVA